MKALKGLSLAILFAVASLTAPIAVAGDTAESGEKKGIVFDDIIGKGNTLKFYGFVRLDAIYDDSRMNNSQTPYYVLPEDKAAGGKKDDGVFTMHPRLSRLGIDFNGSRVSNLADGSVSGKFEIDFQNGGSESRAIPRYRQMYLKIKWDELSVLAGQTWDLVSPLIPSVNNDTLMWNTGNLGDRRAQLRLAYEPKIGDGILSIIGAAALTGAVDAKDLDGDGIRDGEDSGKPQVQARIGYAGAAPWAAGNKAEIGVYGAYLWEDAQAKGNYEGNLVGIDFTIPCSQALALRGEAWTGQNLSDLRGGIGQGVNTATREEIKSKGGWIELLYKRQSNSLAIGWTIDDPDDHELPSSGSIAANGTTSDGRTKNEAYYVSDRFKAGSGVEIGIDYLYWQTDYKTLKKGTDNRVNLVFQYNF